MSHGHESRLPLTAAQTDIWIAHQLSPTSARYLCSTYQDIRGPLDVDVLREAILRALDDAEALRVRFESGGGSASQVVTEVPATVRLIDLTGEESPEDAAIAWMRAAGAEPVDLATGPVAEHAVLVLAPQRHLLFFRYHHIALDGYGQALHLRRVAQIYTALAAGEEPPPSAARPLADLVDEDCRYRESARFERDRRFWRDFLPELPERASLDRGAPSATVSHAEASLPPETVARLQQVAAEADTRWTALLIAAYVAYLHGITEPMISWSGCRSLLALRVQRCALRPCCPTSCRFAYR